MARFDTVTETKLSTQQRIAISFVVGTAVMVVVAVAIAALATLAANRGHVTTPSSDRAFDTH